VLRVVVADDSVLLREGLVRLLTENGHDVVAAVGDGPSLVHAIEERRPDISVVDVRMPPSHTDEGLRAAVEARRRVPGSPVLVLSQYVEVSYADDLLADDAGAIGYPLKDRVTAITDFLDSVQRVGSGGTVLDREVVAQLLVRRRRDDPLAEMTARELEVLALMAEGRSNTNIARTLQAGSTSLAQVGSAIDAGKVKQIASGPEVGLPGYISVTARTQALAEPKLAAVIGDFSQRVTRFQQWGAEHPEEIAKAFVSTQQLTEDQALLAARTSASTLVPSAPTTWVPRPRWI
jgi:DNA-binding NarL/FixJ family response regulator